MPINGRNGMHVDVLIDRVAEVTKSNTVYLPLRIKRVKQASEAVLLCIGGLRARAVFIHRSIADTDRRSSGRRLPSGRLV